MLSPDAGTTGPAGGPRSPRCGARRRRQQGDDDAPEEPRVVGTEVPAEVRRADQVGTPADLPELRVGGRVGAGGRAEADQPGGGSPNAVDRLEHRRPGGEEEQVAAAHRAMLEQGVSAMGKALRDNDAKALRQCEDLIDFNDWFVNQVRGLGIPEARPMHDEAHGALRLPPMIVEGAIDRGVVDQLLEGFGIKVDDREIVMARHRKLVETGDVAGLVVAVKADLDALASRGRLSKQRTRKAPPVEGDLRTTLQDATDAEEVAIALGATSLANLLDE